MRNEARTRIAVDHPGFAAADKFGAYQGEVVSIGYFAHKLTTPFPVFFVLCLPLFPVIRGLVPALVDNLLDLFLFPGRLFFG